MTAKNQFVAVSSTRKPSCNRCAGTVAAIAFESSLLTTEVTYPHSGTTLEGSDVTLLAGATARATPIVKVQFALSGDGFSKRIIGTGRCSFYGCYSTWNTTSVPNGTYVLQSVVQNAIGWRAYSTPIVITVDNSMAA